MWYQLEQKQIRNDSQTADLVDEVVEVNHASVSSYPKVLKLSSGEKLRSWKIELLLWYQVPYQHKDPDMHII